MVITHNSLELYLFLIGGLIIGSFLNTVIYRLPLILNYEVKPNSFKKFNLAYPSSHCPKCESKVPFYLNIPLLAFLFLRGKCFKCKEQISFQYPLVELITGIVFLWVAFNSSDLTKFIFMLVFKLFNSPICNRFKI